MLPPPPPSDHNVFATPHPTRTRTEIPPTPPDAEDPGGGRAGADGADASDPVRSGRPIFSRTRKPQGSRGTDGSQMNRRLRLGSIRAAESSPDPKTPGVARDGRSADEPTSPARLNSGGRIVPGPENPGGRAGRRNPPRSPDPASVDRPNDRATRSRPTRSDRRTRISDAQDDLGSTTQIQKPPPAKKARRDNLPWSDQT
jgi:hypothetical protein